MTRIIFLILNILGGVSAFIMMLASIWVGDDRWFVTAIVVGFALLVVALVRYAIFGEDDGE